MNKDKIKDTDSVSESGESPEDNADEDNTESSADDTSVENADESGDKSEDEDSAKAQETSSFDPWKVIEDATAKTKKFFRSIGFPEMLLLRFIAVYFFFSAIDIPGMREKNTDPINNWRDFVPQVDGLKTILLMSATFISLSLLYMILPKKLRFSDQTLSIAAVIYFSWIVLWQTNNFYLSLPVILVAVVFIYYAVGKMRRCTICNRLSWKITAVVVLALSVMVCWFVAITTIYRHRNFGSASHDFGIFVQMYHSLSNNLTAVTTCERNKPLSHFLVHASYIFYALIPVYKLFPKPETLLISQAILAMGGIIPMFLIAKKHKVKGVSLLFLCLTYVFCNGLIGPCYYEFHENAFLPTLLMWLLWAVDNKKYVMFYIMSVLVCIVKEDAPLYVVCIAMYLFFEEKGNVKRVHGLIAALLSGGYMMFITNWLTVHGDGQMMTSTRFGNLMIDPNGGLKEVVKNVLIDPAYFFSLLIHEDTLPFFLQVMVPMLFLPFFTKKIRRYLLMLPFIVMNMVIGAGYGYAANIGFQYIYGPACLLLYMSIVNLDDLGKANKQEIPILMGTAAMLISVGSFSHNLNNLKSYKNNMEYYTELEEMLDSIPDDAVVGCDTFLCPHTSNRDWLYVFDNGAANMDEGTINEPEKYDFVVISSSSELHNAIRDDFFSNGFTVYDEIPGRFTVYVSRDYSAEH